MAFENVNFGLLKPTVQIENPMDVAMKGLAMQNAQQQVQQGGMQNQQLQKQINDQQELQDTLKNAKSPDEAMSKVQSLGTPTSQGWMQKYIEMKQKGTQLNLDQSKLANEHLARVGGGLLSVANAPGATPQGVANYVMSQAQQGLLDPNGAKDTLSTLPTDPTLLPAWSKLQAVKLGTAEHTLKLFTGETKLQDTGTGFVPTNTNTLTGQVTFPQGKDSVLDKDIGPGTLKKFASDIGAIKDDGTIDMTNPKVQAMIRKETYIAPNILNMLGGGGGNGAGAGNGAAMPPDPSRPWRSNPKFAAIAPGTQPLVDQYLNGDLKVSRGDQQSMLIRQIAAGIDPNVTMHDYDLKQKALADKEVNATNAALGHIGDFKELLGQLDPQTQAKVLNTPLNKLTMLTTDSRQAGILSALQTTGLSLSEEYGKALGAGQNVAGDMKREAVFDPNKPIGQLTSNLQAVGHLMNQTIGAKENMLNRNNPARTPMSLLDPGAAEVLQGLGINHTPGGRVAKIAPAPVDPAAAAQMKNGTISASGKFVWLDGAWKAR